LEEADDVFATDQAPQMPAFCTVAAPVFHDGQLMQAFLTHDSDSCSEIRFLEDEVLHAHVGGGLAGGYVHQLRDRYPTQTLVERLILADGLSRAIQKPANEGDPKATKDVAAEQTEESPQNQQPTEALS
jgi:hypothetical protein